MSDAMFDHIFRDDTNANARKAFEQILGDNVVAQVCRNLAIDLPTLSQRERDRIERAIKTAYWAGASDGVSIRREHDAQR